VFWLLICDNDANARVYRRFLIALQALFSIPLLNFFLLLLISSFAITFFLSFPTLFFAKIYIILYTVLFKTLVSFSESTFNVCFAQKRSFSRGGYLAPRKKRLRLFSRRQRVNASWQK